jgi:amino acid adenylation domain-containing protein
MNTLCEEKLPAEKSFQVNLNEFGVCTKKDSLPFSYAHTIACLCAAMITLIQSFCYTETVSLLCVAIDSSSSKADSTTKIIKLTSNSTVSQLISLSAEALGDTFGKSFQQAVIYFKGGADDGNTFDTNDSDSLICINESMVKLGFAGGNFSDFNIENLRKYYFSAASQLFTVQSKKLSELELVGSQEKSRIESFCGEKAEYDRCGTFQMLFEKSAAENSSKIALVFKDSAVTYGKLNAMADSIAFLLNSKGIGRNDIVAVMNKKSIETVAAIIGIIKAGAAFMMVGTDYPAERISIMLNDSQCSMLITTSALDVVDHSTLPRLYLDDTSVFEQSREAPRVKNLHDDLLYVIYTSGTTGNPKGAMLTHKNLLCMWKAWELSYKLKLFDLRLLQLANMTFDVFVGDMTRAFLSGGRMILCPEESRKNPAVIYKLIQQHQINFMESTPLLLSAFIDYMESRKLKISCLRLLVAGSDNCTVKNFEKIKNYFGSGTKVINSYGITETTIDLSFFDSSCDISGMSSTPIGKPMQNINFKILDKLGRISPIMVYGELYVAGDIVGSGYLGKPELTRERFFEADGQWVYKTGDIAKWLPNGNVLLRGRQDNQVKIRGYRIELNEIRIKLLEHPLITDAAVTVFEHGKNNFSLCAYFIAENEVTTACAKKFLEQRLPSYMVPESFLRMSSFPLTANGKTDLKALPKPEEQLLRCVEVSSSERTDKPADKIDHRLRKIIEKKFGVNLTDDSNLSEQEMVNLGINSITLIELMVDVERSFEIEFDDEFMDTDRFTNYGDLLSYVKSKVLS